MSCVHFFDGLTGQRAGVLRADAPLAPWLGRGRRPVGLVAVASSSSSGSWLVPDELVPSSVDPTDKAEAGTGGGRTVYTLRVSTSCQRGAALSEPMAGVNICLIGKDRRAVLHRVAPVNDSEQHHAFMKRICEVVGPDVGANCEFLAPGAQSPVLPPGKPSGPKPRFTEGCVDEVCLLAPELGPLAALMLAPEGGSWVPDEVNVSSSRSGHTDRFVCRQRLGGRQGEPAAYLTPVPVGAVVYGAGEAAVILTQEQAAALQRASMSSYSDLKQRLLLATALLTAGGSGIAAAACGPYAAVPFAMGGAAGLLYQYMLQVGADVAVESVSQAASDATCQEQESGPGFVLRLLGSPALRLASVGVLALVAVWCTQDQPGPLDTATSTHPPLTVLQAHSADAWQLGVALLGFLMYKVAVVGVSLSPGGNMSDTELAVRQYQNNRGL